jgi:hypothetical protein
VEHEHDEALTSSVGGPLSPGLTDEQAERIRAGLWQLLAVRTKLYTMGDSSSVRIEVAAELSESILYTLNAYQESIGSRIAQLNPEADLVEIFDLGLGCLTRQLDSGKRAAAALPGEMLPIPNQFYQSVPKEINDFFRQYDAYYFAHQSAGFIGYPLNQSVDGLRGIQYINEYLRRFRIENRFCSRFESDAVISLLRVGTPSLEYHVGNFFEPVFAVSIALLLAGKSPFSLNISDDDRVLLDYRLNAWSENERRKQFVAAAERIGRLLGMCEEGDCAYLKVAAELLAMQIRHCRECTKIVFPSPLYHVSPEDINSD